MRVAGLFAGIGGIELGLHQAGHGTDLLCEIDPGAAAVLRSRFPGISVAADVRDLPSLPSVDVLAAGFPCQDLSQAGMTAGIHGSQSSLVHEVFRLIRSPQNSPRWLVLENVSFMLQLNRGRAMHYLTNELEELGFTWAYRVVDTRAFGLPQRRQRVLLVASRTDDPRQVLLIDDAGPRPDGDPAEVACGFYWTEGTRGLGWAVDAVPTLKGGSGVGIPSPPAVRLPAGRRDRGLIVTPSIVDAERLQGFPAGWTSPAVEETGLRRGHRWKLVGNAVSVPVARWLGERLQTPDSYDSAGDCSLKPGEPWPMAAWGRGGHAYRVPLSMWPVRYSYEPLADFLQDPAPLSARATRGFLGRARASNLRFVDGFLADVATHLERQNERQVSAA